MKVLVAVASRHGGTRGIAVAIADALREMGVDAELWQVDDVADLTRYDAAVIGSAVYVGRWLEEATRFVEGNRAALVARPVWLFSSGPLGSEEPKPAGDPQGVAALAEMVGAREHRVFTGKLDPKALGLGERMVAKVVRAPAGDFRDWEAIRDWARAIGTALGAGAAVPA